MSDNLKYALLDVEGGVRTAGGDEPLFERVMDIFLKEARRYVDEYREAGIKGDRDVAERIAHTLKGAAGSVCCDAIRQEAAELEAEAKQGRFPELILDQVKAHFDELDQEYANWRRLKAPEVRKG